MLCSSLVVRPHTGRKQPRSEHAHRYVSEAGFRTICLAAFDGVLVHEDGVIVEATDKCLTLFGCEVGDMVGRTLLEFTAPATHATVLAHAKDRSSESYESIGR